MFFRSDSKKISPYIRTLQNLRYDERFPEAEHFGPVQLYPAKFLEESFTALFESD